MNFARQMSARAATHHSQPVLKGCTNFIIDRSRDSLDATTTSQTTVHHLLVSIIEPIWVISLQDDANSRGFRLQNHMLMDGAVVVNEWTCLLTECQGELQETS